MLLLLLLLSLHNNKAKSYYQRKRVFAVKVTILNEELSFIYVYLTIHISYYISIYVSIYLSIFLSIYVFLCIYLYIYLYKSLKLLFLLNKTFNKVWTMLRLIWIVTGELLSKLWLKFKKYKVSHCSSRLLLTSFNFS